MSGKAALAFDGVLERIKREEKEHRVAAARRQLFHAFGQYQSDELLEDLDRQRKEWQAHREDMLAFQKVLGKSGDREGAKWFKDEAAEAMKRYRGVCTVIGHIDPEWRGDCRWQTVEEVPEEILPYALYAHSIATLASGG